MSKLKKRILIIGGLVIVATVLTLIIMPWGEYESDLEKSDLLDVVEYDAKADSTSSNTPSLGELAGNSYAVQSTEGKGAEILFNLDGMKSTKGGFDKFSISFDVGEDFKQSQLKVEIETASVNTGNSMRDEHILEEDFFDAKKYPKITFLSSTVAMGDTSYIAKGTLNLNGSTKELDVPFLHLGGGDNKGVHFEAFQGAFKFDRVAYGQEESSGVGNEVRVSFYCELNQK